jgi:ABC-type Fe3+/spermidine/putrescine transport system ATPase subunit
MTQEHAIEVRHVSKRFGSRVVLDRVSLAVAPGEIFALLGASGSGKSTLLKIISGIEVPDSGEVWLAGSNVSLWPANRRAVHTVFQNYALFPHLDVAGNVAFPLAVAGVPRKDRMRRVGEALSWVRMESMLHRRIQTLSGGERQRVALARSLVDGIACVLLDEPLSALDPHLRAQTLEFLQDVQERLKVTYMYVTHDRSEALRIAHRIGVLRQGRLEQIGTPQQLYQNPASAFVASFIGPLNWLSGELVHEHGARVVRLATGSRIPLDGQTAPATPRVLIGLRPEHIRLGDPGYLRGRIVQRQFSGAGISLRLELDPSTSVIVEISETDCLHQVGDMVPISWLARRALIFPDEPSN